ncbi:unnamed protein product [Notodromas monacha]|uniref:Uncharacterized protein n=1 Tax=Notodromas monacha TaxID=399045 RepID=A0A7R9BM57_9CRUS|nr:unnamed protein product [Notodromas monacha]CAG0917761.1 unnamed protein product [Notodromas monacha]
MVLRKKMHQVHSSKGADSAMNTVLVPTENNRWVLNHHSHHHQKMRPVSRPTLDPLDPLPVPSWTTWHPDNNNSSAATCWAHHSTASSKPYVNNSATLEDCCGATPGKTFLDLDEANNKEERDAEGTIIAGNVDPSSSSSAIMRWLEQKTPTEDQRMFAQGFQEAYQDVVKRERNPSTSTTPTTAGSACLVSSSDDTSPQSSRLMDDFGCRENPTLRLSHHRVRHHGGNNNNNNKRAVIDKRFNLNRGPLPLELLSEETAAKIEK